MINSGREWDWMDAFSFALITSDKDEDNDDESAYIDGVDERPAPKKTEYNDDEYDY